MIELLAVMVILSILMVYLAFNLTGLGEAAKRSGTLTFLREAGLAASTYEGDVGDYPPSSWKSEWGPTPNKTNLGGEALCITLWAKDYGGTGISDDRLGNTDDDESPKSLTTHGNRNLFEFVDSWGNPIAYFHRRDYGREDTYITIDSEGILDTSVVMARKNPKTDTYHNPRGFQLISAGEDGFFGPDDRGKNDDLYNFDVEIED